MKENWQKFLQLKLRRRLQGILPKGLQKGLLDLIELQTSKGNKKYPIVFCLGSKAPPPMKPKVIKVAVSRKLVMRKNTRLTAQEGKNSSATIKMFSIIVEIFLQKEILIEHDESIFGYQTVTLLTKDVCQVIIDFAAFRNEVIDLWAR